MSKFFLRLSALTLFVNVFVTSANATCVTAFGIEHCPLGNATLSVVNNSLVVSGMASNGFSDGVASQLSSENTNEWSMTSTTSNFTESIVSVEDSSLGFPWSNISSLKKTLDSNGKLILRGKFVSQLYDVKVYSSTGAVVGTYTGVQNGGIGAKVDYDKTDKIGWDYDIVFTAVISGNAQNCKWKLKLNNSASLSVELPNNTTVTGAMIEFTDRSHEIYSFDQITTRGITDLSISSESTNK